MKLGVVFQGCFNDCALENPRAWFLLMLKLLFFTRSDCLSLYFGEYFGSPSTSANKNGARMSPLPLPLPSKIFSSKFNGGKKLRNANFRCQRLPMTSARDVRLLLSRNKFGAVAVCRNSAASVEC